MQVGKCKPETDRSRVQPSFLMRQLSQKYSQNSIIRTSVQISVECFRLALVYFIADDFLGLECFNFKSLLNDLDIRREAHAYLPSSMLALHAAVWDR